MKGGSQLHRIRALALCGVCLLLAAGITAGCRSADPAPDASSAPVSASSSGPSSYTDIPTVPAPSSSPSWSDTSDDTTQAPSAPSQSQAPRPSADSSSPQTSSGSAGGSSGVASDGFSLEDLYPANRHYTPVAEEDKWYYKNLSTAQKEIYHIIDKAAREMQEGRILLGSCTYPDLALAYTAVKSDHPEYFWLPTGYIYEMSGGQMYMAFSYTGGGYEIDYTYTEAERDLLAARLRQVLEEAGEELSAGMSEYERELALHDWLASRLTYDEETAAGSDAHPEAFTIACLLDGRAVCEGYARSFQLLLNFAGIESTLVTGGIGDTGHMWNLVKIDGLWYHADATWNDSGDKGLHTYFNMTDAGIAADHVLDPDFDELSYDDLMDNRSFNYHLPACTSTAANYFARTGGLITGEAAFADEVAQGLAATANRGGRGVEFCFADTYDMTFTSSEGILRWVTEAGCVRQANARLPADKQLPAVITCNGIVGSKGFRLSW